VAGNAEKYEQITGAIIAKIEAGGLLPWQKPWIGGASAPRSMSTGKEYRGINWWILGFTAEETGNPWFGTYKQIEALGGQVRKGERSATVILWKPMTKVDAQGNEEKFFMLRTFNVFNATQADGLPEKFYSKPTEADFTLDMSAQEALEAYVTREGIPVTYGGTSASYSPREDRIRLPKPDAFLSTEGFYATAFHECAHSTGAASRLNREGVANFDHFGSHQYSREELVAEMGSAIVMGMLGLDKPNLVDNQAAYLAHWVKNLKEDPQALVWAAGRADKAADLILKSDIAVETEEA